MFVYNSSIEVPDECETVEQAIEYAKKHMGEIPISSEPEFVHDIAIDEDNCCFAEE